MLTLMGGSAAIAMPALGNSSVQPAIVALGFLVLRFLLPTTGDEAAGRLAGAVRDNALLVIFCLYGALGAYILPHVFAGDLSVTPLRPDRSTYLFATSPLRFTSQNITVSVYLMATLAAAIIAHAAVQKIGTELAVARTAARIALIHAWLGISGVVLAGTAYSQFLAFFRNGSYAQLNQTIGGFVRMNGILPEPAVYAVYGFTWFVFNVELWLRDVETRWTGPAAIIMGLALLASTSSTAYVGLAGYGFILGMRMLFSGGSVRLGKLLALAACVMIGVAAILSLLVSAPEIAAMLGNYLAQLTVDKASSDSGLQRAFWARQGIDAFMISGGLGVGAGSFRSSSIVTAVIGSLGVIGIASLALFLIKVVKPLHRQTFGKVADGRVATGVAAGWTAAIMLMPSALSAPSPDPGIVWGILCGTSLALRQRKQPARRNIVIGIDHGSAVSNQGAVRGI
jgi:hypothetical protein